MVTMWLRWHVRGKVREREEEPGRRKEGSRMASVGSGLKKDGWGWVDEDDNLIQAGTKRRRGEDGSYTHKYGAHYNILRCVGTGSLGVSRIQKRTTASRCALGKTVTGHWWVATCEGLLTKKRRCGQLGRWATHLHRTGWNPSQTWQ
jgi:hypothetical protein